MTTNNAQRAKWRDGRTVAVLGDEVYQMCRGPFGSAAIISGVVVSGKRGGLRVKVTGSGSFMGDLAARKTYAYNEYWTVKNDPVVIERERIAKAEMLSRQKAEQFRKAEREDAIRRNVAENGKITANTLTPGDVLIDIFRGHRFTVTSIDDGIVEGRFDGGEYVVTPGLLDMYRREMAVTV